MATALPTAEPTPEPKLQPPTGPVLAILADPTGHTPEHFEIAFMALVERTEVRAGNLGLGEVFSWVDNRMIVVELPKDFRHDELITSFSRVRGVSFRPVCGIWHRLVIIAGE